MVTKHICFEKIMNIFIFIQNSKFMYLFVIRRVVSTVVLQKIETGIESLKLSGS